MDGPLAGIRIVDLTSAVVGPYATQILADSGADVIKVEERRGDVMRWIAGPSPTPGMPGKFLHLNRNKRSISLDLKQPRGREALLRLTASADVFLHNMRPAAMARLGLAKGDIAAVNPQTIYCAIVGFSQAGPLHDRPAYDSILQGGTGLASLTGREGEPSFVPYVVIDRTAGLMVANALTTALFERLRTGRSRALEIPMFESFTGMLLSEHMYARTFDPPQGEAGDLRLLDAQAKPVPTSDGYICITTNTDAQVAALFDAIGRPDLKEDTRFNNGPARIQHIREFFLLRADALRTRSTGYWLEAMVARDIPVMAVATLQSLLSDDYLQKVGLLVADEHPTQGRIWSIANTFMPGAEASPVRRHAPHIGQHTADVLAELGYDEAEIATLFADGVAVRSDIDN